MTEIIHIPNQILTNKTKIVTKYDKKLKILIKNMVSALVKASNPRGVGLAAPQIGESYAVFLMRPTLKSQIRVFINPEIVKISKDYTPDDKKGKLEGCLSIPNVWGYVKRHTTLTLKYSDINGITHQEDFTGFEAIIIQHEMDHLNGTLFTFRVLEQNGKFYQSQKTEDGKEELHEIHL